MGKANRAVSRRATRRELGPDGKLQFGPEIYEGLQLPATAAKAASVTAKRIVVEAVMTAEEIKGKEGTHFTEKDATQIFDEDVDVYGKESAGAEPILLAKFRKNVVPADLIRTGWEAYYRTAAPSRNRGAAAGPIQLDSKYWQKRKATKVVGWSASYIQKGKVSKMSVNNNVFSSVLGYFEQTPFMGLPCRLTSYTQKYFHRYKHGIPFIQALDGVFKRLVPDRHKKQLAAAKAAPSYQIAGTAFSSVTINRNFRTALHMDDGDFREGFGNLSVIERGKYHGGATILPRYGVGFNVRTGDFLAMNVHEWHCNTEMREEAGDAAFNKGLPRIHTDSEETGTLGAEKPFTRISFVCYLREKLRGCKMSETQAYYDRIKFDPEKGKVGQAVTRKAGKAAISATPLENGGGSSGLER
jgi:hypothetical protein